jgi:hypothetical protein
MARFFIAHLIGVMTCCFSQHLYSYPVPVDFNGKLQRWNIDRQSAPISYFVKDQSEAFGDLKSAVEDAFAMWQDIPTSYIAFTEAASEQEAQIVIKLVSQIAGEFSSGFAQVETDSGGYMAACNLQLLAGPEGDNINFRKTALHEIGHCIGLGHSLVPESIMSYKIEKNDYKLDTDDIAAVTRLYPMEESAPELPPGCSVIDGRIAQNSSLLWWILIFPVVMVGLGGLRREMTSLWR